MDQKQLDHVLKLARQVVSGGDFHFATDQSKSAMSKILMTLTKDFRRSPIFVAALCSYLKELGFNLASLRIDAMIEFQESFGGRFARITPEENERIAQTKTQLATRLT